MLLFTCQTAENGDLVEVATHDGDTDDKYWLWLWLWLLCSTILMEEQVVGLLVQHLQVHYPLRALVNRHLFNGSFVIVFCNQCWQAISINKRKFFPGTYVYAFSRFITETAFGIRFFKKVCLSLM